MPENSGHFSVKSVEPQEAKTGRTKKKVQFNYSENKTGNRY
jgi:hypothetical protein